jgi:hypothetical protein
MYYSFECPKCGDEITAEVDVGEHMVDWAEECENEKCGYKFTESEVLTIYDDALADCFGTMIDNAHDMAKDRQFNI